MPAAWNGPSLFKRILTYTTLTLLLLVVAALIFAWNVGLWNILFPSHQHDTQAPAIPSNLAQPSVMIFSKTNSFRHIDGIEGGNRTLTSIAKKNGWGVFSTENGAIFNPEDLKRFQVVVFLNASGDMLDSAQERAFQTWLEAGGGWLGIHAAGDGSHAAWQWYRDQLIGASFTAHIMGPQFQRAAVVMEDFDHPVAAQLPAIWDHTEEWYSWERSPREEDFNIIATIDESSYSPYARLLGQEADLRMTDHPVVWSNCVGEGRTIYTAMGHTAEAFEQPQFKQLLENALSWTLGLDDGESGDDCPEP